MQVFVSDRSPDDELSHHTTVEINKNTGTITRFEYDQFEEKDRAFLDEELGVDFKRGCSTENSAERMAVKYNYIHEGTFSVSKNGTRFLQLGLGAGTKDPPVPKFMGEVGEKASREISQMGLRVDSLSADMAEDGERWLMEWRFVDYEQRIYGKFQLQDGGRYLAALPFQQ